jgi:hypothetical protein
MSVENNPYRAPLHASREPGPRFTLPAIAAVAFGFVCWRFVIGYFFWLTTTLGMLFDSRGVLAPRTYELPLSVVLGTALSAYLTCRICRGHPLVLLAVFVAGCLVAMGVTASSRTDPVASFLSVFSGLGTLIALATAAGVFSLATYAPGRRRPWIPGRS